MVIVLQLTGHYVDQDVQFISLCVLMLNVLLNPLLHCIVRRPVRRALLLSLEWLVYIMFGCKESLHPNTHIGTFLSHAFSSKHYYFAFTTDVALGLRVPATVPSSSTTGIA